MDKDSGIMIRVVFAVLIMFQPLAKVLAQENPIQVHHGTVILYEETPTQIILAADSKLFSGTGKGERACKIVGLSQDVLFFYTGQLYKAEDSQGRELLSQQKVARQAYRATKDVVQSYQRLRNLGIKYSELVRPEMEQLFKIAWSHDFRRAIGLAGFASIDEFGHPRMVLVNIPINTSDDSGKQRYTTGTPILSEPAPFEVQLGIYDPYKAVKEFLDDDTPRAEQAMNKFRSIVPSLPKTDVEVHKLIAAVQASLDWNKNDLTIGPPINAAVIEPGAGIRWVQGKSRCGSQAIPAVTPR